MKGEEKREATRFVSTLRAWTQVISRAWFVSPLLSRRYFDSQEAVETLAGFPDLSDIAWVVGGTVVYEEAMGSSLCHRVYLTEIDQSFECDIFFPKINLDEFELVQDPEVPQELQREGDVTYNFRVYQKIWRHFDILLFQ